MQLTCEKTAPPKIENDLKELILFFTKSKSKTESKWSVCFNSEGHGGHEGHEGHVGLVCLICLVKHQVHLVEEQRREKSSSAY